MDAVAVTGMGCVSSLGAGSSALWSGLTAGRSGIKQITQFATEGLRNACAGCVDMSASLYSIAQTRGIKARLEVFAASAIDEALADAGWTKELLSQARVALVAGTSLGMSLVAPTLEAEILPRYDDAQSGADLSLLANKLGGLCGLESETTLVSTACASGTHAIGLARDLIVSGYYDVVIAGGADALDRAKYLGHSALATLSESVPRPFSRLRDGTLFGEGAAFLVLERAGTGAAGRAYAHCRGTGYSNDIHHLTAPDPEGRGAAEAMQGALRDGGIEAADIDHINLHGSGTALNDDAEAIAISEVFGARARDIACTSNKASIGHAMGAAGAIEAVATVLALYHGEVPPTLNVSTRDVAFEVGLVCGNSVRRRIVAALSNSFGFGGANGVLLFVDTDGAERRPGGKP